jgi:hypothetical protein
MKPSKDKLPDLLDYRSPTPSEPAAPKHAVFLPVAWISLGLGSISAIGFLTFAGWSAPWSAGISLVALSLGIASKAAGSADRSIRSCSIWLAGCGTLIFGAVAAMEILLMLKC